MFLALKQNFVNFLEQHPLGYRLGVLALDHFDFLLPHETDYHAFPLFASALKPAHRCILDVGGNRGHSSRAFLKLLPEWQVIAFEANPLHKKKLESIKRKYPNRFDYHIKAASCLCGDDVTIFTPMYANIAMHSASALTEKDALEGVRDAFPNLADKFTLIETLTSTIAIDTLSLDASMIKIDVQGCEYEVLLGLSELITRCKPVILIEMNLKMTGVQQFFENKNYKPIRFYPEKNQLTSGWNEVTLRDRNQFFIHESFLSEFN